MDFIKSKTFCASKDIIRNMKRQPTKWEKIFANHITNKYPEHVFNNKKAIK